MISPFQTLETRTSSVECTNWHTISLTENKLQHLITFWLIWLILFVNVFIFINLFNLFYYYNYD